MDGSDDIDLSSGKGAMSAVITGAIAAAIPMMFHASSSSVSTVNGRVVSATYRDWVAIGCGGFAIVCGIAAIVMAIKSRAKRALLFGALVIVAGGIQIARGTGVFETAPDAPAFADSDPMRIPEPPPKVIADPKHPDECPDGDSCFELAEKLEATDKPGAVIAYSKACDFKLAGGCFNAANNMGRGADPVKTMALFQRACDLGSEGGCSNAAVGYLLGEGVPKDLERARKMLTETCDRDDATGCRNLAVMYRDGQGVAVDAAKVLVLLSKACELGNHEEAGACSVAGAKLVETDTPRALKYFEKACSLDPSFCLNLGVANASGMGMAKDPAKARTLYDKACTAGNASACNNLGDLMNRGIGGAKDKAAAHALFQKACDGGEKVGCENLE
ncbi:hypothetical protein BH11MYX3_BH11MYX3_26370 [soil metagenome]